MSPVRIALIATYLLSTSACTKIIVAENKGKHHQYFGFVDVYVPKTEDSITALKIQSLGVAIENGFSVGWRDKELVLVPLEKTKDGSPSKKAVCSIVVIIRSSKEAVHAEQILSTLKQNKNEEEICLATFK